MCCMIPKILPSAMYLPWWHDAVVCAQKQQHEVTCEAEYAVLVYFPQAYITKTQDSHSNSSESDMLGYVGKL